jgi:hypothetical protein
MYGDKDVEEVPKPNAKTFTFVDAIQKRESSMKKIKKHEDVPTLVDLEEQCE